MAGNRNLMNHCRNESSGIERYIGTSYDHLVKVSENMDTINFIAANIDSILEGVIITQGDIIGQIQEEGKNMLEGIQKDMQDYVKKFEKDIDIIIDEKFSFIDETLTGIIHDSEFAIKQREFEARIGEVEIVIANEKEANASTRRELEVKYEDNRAKIEMLDQVIATNEFTMSEFYKKVELEMNGNTGRIEDLSKAIVDNEKAWLEKSSYLEGVIGENTSYIKDVQNVLVESNKAIAESLTELDATVGGFSAEITSVKKVTADLEKAQAEMSDRLSATNKDLENTSGKVGELSSEVLLTTLVESTNASTSARRTEVMSSALTTVDGKVSKVSKEIQDLKDNDLKNMNEYIDSKVSDVYRDLNKDIGDLSTSFKEESVGINKKISDNTTSISGLGTQIGDIDSTIGDHKKLIDANKKAIDDIEFPDNSGIIEDIEVLESHILLERLTETTNTSTQSSNAQLQLSIINDNSSKILLQQMTQANESEVRASQTNMLSSQWSENKSAILLEQLVVSNEMYTRASENKLLIASTLQSKASFEEFQQVYASDKLALSESIIQLKSEIDTEINGKIAKLESTITETNNTITDLEKSMAENSLELKSEVLAEISRTDLATRESLKGDINTSANDLRKDFDSKLEANKTETDKIMEEVIGTDIKELQDSIFDIGNDISTTNKKITDNKAATDKALSDAEIALKKDMEDKIKSAGEVIYLSGTAVPKTPKEYATKYGKTSINEFGVGKWFDVGNNLHHTVTTTVSYLTGLENGRVTQTAVENVKTGYPTIRDRKSTSDTTWSEWVVNETSIGAQAKADAAKKSAVDESKKYTDGESDKINTTITAEIKQVNSTIATVDGKVLAMTKLTAETTVLGERVISGLAFGSDGKQANFKIFADNFAIVSTDGRVEVPAFTSTMVGGKAQVGINGDLFVKGSINGDVLKANSVLVAPTIQGGEMYLGNGRFEVNKQGEVKIRADASKNVGLQITNERIDVYDENGILRVRMGKLK